MPTIKISLGIGFAGEERTGKEFVDDEEWNAMTEDEKEKRLSEIAEDFASNYIDLAAWVDE